MQGHIQQESHRKIFDLGWSVQLYSPQLATSGFYSIYSLQNTLNDKKKSAQEDPVKMFVNNLLITKPAESDLRRIKKLPDK